LTTYHGQPTKGSLIAAGDPILLNLTGATFLLTAETGVIIQSESRETSSKVKEVFNAATGYTVGEVHYDFNSSISWSGIVNGSTGLFLAAPGVALTLATSLGANGVATGGVYTRTVSVSHQAEDLRMISGTAMQRHGIA
jgi:hypothetical protein